MTKFKYPDKGLGPQLKRFEDTFSVADCIRKEFGFKKPRYIVELNQREYASDNWIIWDRVEQQIVCEFESERNANAYCDLINSVAKPVKKSQNTECSSPSKKTQLSRLLEFKHTLRSLAHILEHGENKHGSDKNYTTYPISKDIDAALRHLLEWDKIDDETGELHILHAICRLLFVHTKHLNNAE